MIDEQKLVIRNLLIHEFLVIVEEVRISLIHTDVCEDGVFQQLLEDSRIHLRRILEHRWVLLMVGFEQLFVLHPSSLSTHVEYLLNALFCDVANRFYFLLLWKHPSGNQKGCYGNAPKA